MILNPHIFREYDIRGVAERDLSDAVAVAIGQGFGTWLRRQGADSLAVGRDCRLHSPRLHQALCQGLLQSGMNVLDVGVVPSPLLYFAVHHLQAGGGAQITGSHNPPSDNGFKLLHGQQNLHGPALQELRALIERRDFLHGHGQLTELDIHAAYATFVTERLQLGPRRFPVVIDAGNGCGGVDSVPLLTTLGFSVTALHCEMDGRFPHHPPDPTVPEHLAELAATVRKTGAELGLAFDGDADRLAVVDAEGRIIWGDQLMILFARAILCEEPGATFVCEVKSSRALYDEIARAGGTAVMWRVGHSAIKEKMREVHAALGGEMSGHLFFAHRYLGFDDAIYAAARLCELLSRSPLTLAQHVDSLPRLYNTPEIRLPVPDASKFALAQLCAQRLRDLPGAQVVELDGARIHLPGAWALVRASNTQPALVLRLEAESEPRLHWIAQQLKDILRRAAADLPPNLKADLRSDWCEPLSAPPLSRPTSEAVSLDPLP